MISTPTAAIIIIGNEILSGRTQDLNTQYIATELQNIGIKLTKVHIIPDIHKVIVEAIKSLKNQVTYLFTSGGIGPTHDDITIAAVAEAIGVELELNMAAQDLIKQRFTNLKKDINDSALKMAYLPINSKLIHNPISLAPGCQIENIFVFAGVPKILQAMLKNVIPLLQHGPKIYIKNFEVMAGESLLAQAFQDLQHKYAEVEMGSYPFKRGENNYGTNLVLQSTNYDDCNNAYLELEIIIKNLIADIK